MKAIFLSDAHLRSPRDTGYGNLLRFLDEMEPGTDHLFIVGDFFDFWFCRKGRLYPPFRAIVEKLLGLQRRGVQLHLFEGNHDFFLDDYFSDYGVEVVPESATVELEKKRIYVSHGDRVDRSNRRYLLLRKFLRSPAVYLLQKSLPPSLLWSIAKASSDLSRGQLGWTEDGLTSIMRNFAETKFQNGYDAVVLGHCHRPLISRMTVGGKERILVLLGDWISHFTYLCYEKGSFELMNYRM